MDFKGWWLALDKGRCEPLTIRDAFSRYVLHIEVLSTTAMPPVRAVFEAVFARYGLPKVILTDNGTPFVSSFNVLGLTKLSAWWLSLGIEHIRTRPATPSDNGGHERMHRDIAAELERFKALNRYGVTHTSRAKCYPCPEAVPRVRPRSEPGQSRTVTSIRMEQCLSAKRDGPT